MKNRKGFTLAELAMVLAITSIISTMVIGTLSWVSKQNTRSINTNMLMNDLYEVHTQIDKWVKTYDADENEFSVVGNTVIAKNTEEEHTLTFDNENKIISENGEEGMSVDCSAFTKISVESVRDTQTGNMIMILVQFSYFDQVKQTELTQKMYCNIHSSSSLTRTVKGNIKGTEELEKNPEPTAEPTAEPSIE